MKGNPAIANWRCWHGTDMVALREVSSRIQADAARALVLGGAENV